MGKHLCVYDQISHLKKILSSAALEESSGRISQLEKVVDDYNQAQADIAEQRRKAEELEAQLAEAAHMHEEEKLRLVRAHAGGVIDGLVYRHGTHWSCKCFGLCCQL